MSQTAVEYFELPLERSWIAHLRVRLPYSFSEIRAEGPPGRRKYILSNPLLTRSFQYHNFWKRGYVYYATARLLDIYELPLYWREYRSLHTDEIRSEYAGEMDYLLRFPRYVFNALQLEKLWSFVARDHIDRERAVMTNLIQAVEFCLKGIKSHAEYRETGVFVFREGHDLRTIYDSLPQPLKLEMHAESIRFVSEYSNFRKSVEGKISELEEARTIRPNARPSVDAWRMIADNIEQTSYTAFLDANDPASPEWAGYGPEDWFEHALGDIEALPYHRYSPWQGRDEYPVKPIHLGLILGRFMYEHLFPVPVEAEET